MKPMLAADALGCQDHLEAQLDRLLERERREHLQRCFNRAERQRQGPSHASSPRQPGRQRIADLF